jgi:hypothetical protein
VLTSTFQPWLLVYSQSSREVLTLFESTAVQVGRMAPSPPSIAETSIKKVTRYAYSQLFTYFIVRQHEATKPVQQRTQYSAYHGRMRQPHLTPSARMSFLRRCSIASRFSGRSERCRVFLGSDESLRTKGRPDMYTDCPETRKESLRARGRSRQRYYQWAPLVLRSR